MTRRLVARALLLTLPLAGLTGLAAAPAGAAAPAAAPVQCPKYPTTFHLSQPTESVVRAPGKTPRGKAVRYDVTMAVTLTRGGKPCHSSGVIFHTGGHAAQSRTTNSHGTAYFTLNNVTRDFTWYAEYMGTSTTHRLVQLP